MSSAASPQAAPPPAARTSLGGIALRLAVGSLVGGPAALVLDLIAELVVTGGSDPFGLRSWPVPPLLIVALMGLGWLAALVLAVRAIVKRERRDLAAAAVVIALVPEVVVVYVVGMVVVANWPWR